MVLSNAERQERFRQRRHGLAASADLKGYGYCGRRTITELGAILQAKGALFVR